MIYDGAYLKSFRRNVASIKFVAFFTAGFSHAKMGDIVKFIKFSGKCQRLDDSPKRTRDRACSARPGKTATNGDKCAATATSPDTTTETKSDIWHIIAANRCLEKTHGNKDTAEQSQQLDESPQKRQKRNV